MDSLPTFDEGTALRIAAGRAALGGTVARWLIHELRGPVQVLTLIPDLLDQASAPDQPTLRMLRDGAATMERVATTLDDFLQRPPVTPVIEPVIVDPLLAMLVRVGASHRGDVRVSADEVPHGVPAMAAVEGWLPQCVGAVLVNAIESCEDQHEGQVRLTVSADSDRVCIGVHDDGPGFPAAVAAAAFTGCSTRASQGWPRGLGLPVARVLARAMGGDVMIARNLPGDVCVEVQLPAWTTNR